MSHWLVQEEAKDAFKEMLRDAKVSSTATWEGTMRTVINDRRYRPKTCSHLPAVSGDVCFVKTPQQDASANLARTSLITSRLVNAF